MRLRELADVRRRFGYRHLCTLLRRESWRVGYKLVYRRYREEGLSLRIRRRVKRASHVRVARPLPTGANQRWNMNFVADALVDGRKIRVLAVVDNWSRFCPLLTVGYCMSGTAVAHALQRTITRSKPPKVIQVDNGSEFYSKATDAFAFQNGMALDFIRPGNAEIPDEGGPNSGGGSLAGVS